MNSSEDRCRFAQPLLHHHRDVTPGQKVCPERGCGKTLGGTNHVPAQAGSNNITLPEGRGYCLKHPQVGVGFWARPKKERSCAIILFFTEQVKQTVCSRQYYCTLMFATGVAIPEALENMKNAPETALQQHGKRSIKRPIKLPSPISALRGTLPPKTYISG